METEFDTIWSNIPDHDDQHEFFTAKQLPRKKKDISPEIDVLTIPDTVKHVAMGLLELYDKHDKGERTRKNLVFYVVCRAFDLVGGQIPPPEKIAQIVKIPISGISSALTGIDRRRKLNFKVSTPLNYVEYYWNVLKSGADYRIAYNLLEETLKKDTKLYPGQKKRLSIYHPQTLTAGFLIYYMEINGHSKIDRLSLKSEVKSYSTLKDIISDIDVIYNL